MNWRKKGKNGILAESQRKKERKEIEKRITETGEKENQISDLLLIFRHALFYRILIPSYNNYLDFVY